MLVVEIYSRPDCHLCEVAKAVIATVQTGAQPPFELREIDISDDPELEQRFGLEIPVVFIAGRKAFKYRVDEDELRDKLRRTT